MQIIKNQPLIKKRMQNMPAIGTAVEGVCVTQGSSFHSTDRVSVSLFSVWCLPTLTFHQFL
jgi:hypothetical protein